MKQIKTLLIAAILVLGASQTINAQAKTAHVDVSDIMTKMPAKKPVSTALFLCDIG